jgi:general secretion pathway protein C
MINDRQISRLFWAAKAGLAALLLYAIVEAVLTPFRLDTAFKPNAVAGDEQTRAFIAVASDNEGATDSDTIVENDIFAGTNAAADAGVSQIADSMPSAEELGLRLVGVIAGGPVASRAVIESGETGSARPYKIGDIVASAAIESIEPDRVILLYAGQRRSLLLHTAATVNDRTDLAGDERPNTANAEGPPPTDTQDVPTPMKLAYVEDLFQKATIEPHVENGRTDGLRITGLEQTPLDAMFGLRNGDIVRTVNGQSLTSKQKAFQVLKKARTQSKLHIQLVRDGKTRDLSFDL